MYRKVLLATYWSADATGLLCAASNEEIAKVAGVTTDTARAYIRDMANEGTLAVFGDEGLPCRVIVLLDHPDAPALVKKAEKARRTRDRGERERRVYWTFHDRLVKALS
jgi:hypothetical protein